MREKMQSGRTLPLQACGWLCELDQLSRLPSQRFYSPSTYAHKEERHANHIV